MICPLNSDPARMLVLREVKGQEDWSMKRSRYTPEQITGKDGMGRLPKVELSSLV